MKKTPRILIAILLCCTLINGPTALRAQDASHIETAKAEDSSDWGLLGLLGLIGLLGLRWRDRTDHTPLDRSR